MKNNLTQGLYSELYHYGVFGMRWGVVKERTASGKVRRNLAVSVGEKTTAQKAAIRIGKAGLKVVDAIDNSKGPMAQSLKNVSFAVRKKGQDFVRKTLDRIAQRRQAKYAEWERKRRSKSTDSKRYADFMMRNFGINVEGW